MRAPPKELISQLNFTAVVKKKALILNDKKEIVHSLCFMRMVNGVMYNLHQDITFTEGALTQTYSLAKGFATELVKSKIKTSHIFIMFT